MGHRDSDRLTVWRKGGRNEASGSSEVWESGNKLRQPGMGSGKARSLIRIRMI